MQQPVQQFTNKNQLHILARLGAQIFIESRKMLSECETQLKQLLIYLKQFHLFSGRLKRHDVLLRHSAHFETWSLSLGRCESHPERDIWRNLRSGHEKAIKFLCYGHSITSAADEARLRWSGRKISGLDRSYSEWRSSEPTVQWPLGRKRSTDGHNKNRSLVKH